MRTGVAGFLRMSGAALFFTALTAVFCYPLSTSPGTRALDLGADTRLFLWTLGWDFHALVENPAALFDANIFHPRPKTLAYSEHLLASALLAAPVQLLTGNLLASLNAVVLFSCVASGFGAFLLANRLGVGFSGALAAGMIFAFAPPRFFRLGQLHLATVQWIPLCLVFLHAYAAGGTRRHLLLAGLFFTLQALSGGQSGLFLLMAAAGLVLYLAVLGELGPRSHPGRDALVVGALSLAVNLPAVLPYFEVRREVGLKRSLEEAEPWSPNAASFLAAPTRVQKALLPPAALKSARSYLFPGFATLALALFALSRRRDVEPTSVPSARPRAPALFRAWDAAILLAAAASLLVEAAGGFRFQLAGLTLSTRSGFRLLLLAGILGAARLALARSVPWSFRDDWRRIRARVRRAAEKRMGIPLGFYLLLALFSLWASLGPEFGLYGALYRLVPGMDFVRVPARLTILTLLALAVLAGSGLDRLLLKVPARWRPRLGVAALSLLALEFAAFPLDAPRYALPAPAVDRWLAEQPGRFAIVELPVADPRDAARSARLHSLYMLHGMAHWQKMVNGYSGFTPPAHDALFRALVRFPDEASLSALEQLGVGYAVVHPDLYTEREWRDFERRSESFGERLKRVALFSGPEGRVYLITRSAPALPADRAR
jgi:hypothetical protein